MRKVASKTDLPGCSAANLALGSEIVVASHFPKMSARLGMGPHDPLFRNWLPGTVREPSVAPVTGVLESPEWRNDRTRGVCACERRK